MYFRQVLHRDLSCASYVVADGGAAAVVDPKWEIEDYVALAEEEGFEIRHILETHTHADHLSGRGRLAEATGATIWLSPTPDVAYDHRVLADGQAVELGDVRIVARATPGHRPEHTAYLVVDRARGESPWMVLTGDSLFVGDVARPDLAVEAEEGARGLYRSLRDLLGLEDFVEVWPGHIGGSLCGGADMSETPGSTIGFERRFNPRLAIASEKEFVHSLTSDLPQLPPNFRRIVELNRGPLVARAAALEALAPARVAALMADGAILLDGRAPREFAAEHVPGSLSTTMSNAAVGTRAAWVLDADADVVVLAAADADAARMGRMVEAVGILGVRGYLAGGISAWAESTRPTASTPSIDVAELARRLQEGDVVLLDVREDDEWRSGHVEGSLHTPYHELRDGPPDGLPEERPVAVACSVGNRSSLAVSLLERHGRTNLVHVAAGGVQHLPRHGIELVEGD
jgi:hydroxyacylglutathione hydrolase